jgi:hypothetical protein
MRPWGIGVLALVAMISSASNSAASIVVNGDFEAGSTGWTTNNWFIGNLSRGVIGTRSTWTGADGGGAVDSALIFQTLNTVPGTVYDLTFYVYADGLPDLTNNFDNGLRVRWDGAIVGDYVNIPTTNPNFFLVPGGPMTLFTISGLLATDAATELSFGGRDDPSLLFIDNVAVVAAPGEVPEPAQLLVWSVLAACGAWGIRKAS